VLGLIGRNGAGKTTLLKILSRITRHHRLGGDSRRVGSLLEVGQGSSGADRAGEHFSLRRDSWDGQSGDHPQIR